MDSGKEVVLEEKVEPDLLMPRADRPREGLQRRGHIEAALNAMQANEDGRSERRARNWREAAKK